MPATISLGLKSIDDVPEIFLIGIVPLESILIEAVPEFAVAKLT